MTRHERLAPAAPVSPAGAATFERPAACIGAQAEQDHARSTGEAGAPNLSTYSDSNRSAVDAAVIAPGQPKTVGRGLGNKNATATPSKMRCRECNGKGEAEYMGLLDSYYRWMPCHVCDGSGVEAPYCETCGGKLAVDGWCYPCDDYGEGFAPEGWLKAETSAFGMVR